MVTKNYHMHVEKPDKGRTTIREEGGSLRIIIPTKKGPGRVFMVLFMCAWLGGWAVGEVSAARELTGQLFNGTKGGQLPPEAFAFLLFWLIAWTIGGIVIFGIILYSIFGREIITFSPEVLTLEKKVFKFGRMKHYALSDVKNLRIYKSDNLGFWSMFFYRVNQGTLAFDYGVRTIRFADEVDDAEAQHIIQRIKDRYGTLS